jgi:two-component system, NtrC family, response regulator GlrR
MTAQVWPPAEPQPRYASKVPISELTMSVAERAASVTVRGAKLTVTKGPDAGRTARIDRPTFSVGTGQTADLRLSDPSMSREHLRIFLMPDGVRLRDQDSKNGTSLGGMRVRDVTLSQDAAVTLAGTTLSIALERDPLELELSTADRFGDAIGGSAVMRHLFATLERVAPSELSVLIEGESGVGKDLLARAVHARSARADGAFVVVDCGAIPPDLIESELFGHERGSFTGAETARRGVFEEANGGTLFLDEIGELPFDMQPKLLRVLEQREVRPVGGRTARPIDVRVIAATNRRLGEAARAGEFRSDLFYRLAVVRVTAPPLRERPEDVLPIARAILRAIKRDATAEFPVDFASMLGAYTWPGNVRELRNVVERYAVFGSSPGVFDHATPVVHAKDEELANLTFHEARKIVLDRFEEAYLPRVLERANGVIAHAAELAGVARPSFYRMMDRLRANREGAK